MSRADNQRYKQGQAVRREVLGDAHVDRSLVEVSDFARPMQELVTEYCWGEIWSRPGLGRRERSLINLGMLTALNRPHELRVHVRGALRNGCGPQEIAEVLLQASIYAGAPAGLDAFRVAEQVIEEVEREAADKLSDEPTV